jgi:RimJ/RimL family protein N-acetyltransferase
MTPASGARHPGVHGAGWPGAGVVLEGRLARLEPLTEAHAGDLYAAAQDPRIWTWMPADASRSPEAFGRFFGDALAAAARGEEVPFAVRERASGAVAGSTRYLALAPEHRRLEIGWTWYSPRVWGTGLNVECKLLLMTHAFERLGCQRVELKTDARNERSRGAMLALGATFEGIHRKHMVRETDVRDTAWYSVIDDEWPAVRERLRARLDR